MFCRGEAVSGCAFACAVVLILLFFLYLFCPLFSIVLHRSGVGSVGIGHIHHIH